MEQFLYYFEVFGYLFFVIASIGALIAHARVNSTFRRFSKQSSALGLTGRSAAERVLQNNGVFDVKIAKTPGNLTDHYDPRNNTVYLSDAVYDSTSTAAIGVAAHEAGHAVQHAAGYVPIKLRQAIVPVCNLGSKLSIPLILIGLALSAGIGFSFGYYLALAGVLFYSLAVVFQLVTLPTEFNASRRAMTALEEGGILSDEELKGARKTLTAAAMTYVSALAVTLVQFLRLFAMVMGGRRNRR